MEGQGKTQSHSEKSERPADVSPVGRDQTASVDITLPLQTLVLPNARDKLCVWQVQELFELGMWSSACTTPQSHLKDFYERGFGIFTISHQTRLTHNFHDLVKKWDHVTMEFTEEIKHVGNTSYSAFRCLTDKFTRNVLATAYTVWAAVSMETRRPCSLPQWFRSNFRRTLPASPSERRLTVCELANRRYTCDFTVTPTDTDLNGHVNQAVFVRYVMNCAAIACDAGFYENFRGDIFRYDVEEQSILYLDEARKGATLRVHTWEDETSSNVLHFHIVDISGKLLVYISTRFFWDHPLAKL